MATNGYLARSWAGISALIGSIPSGLVCGNLRGHFRDFGGDCLGGAIVFFFVGVIVGAIYFGIFGASSGRDPRPDEFGDPPVRSDPNPAVGSTNCVACRHSFETQWNTAGKNLKCPNCGLLSVPPKP